MTQKKLFEKLEISIEDLIEEAKLFSEMMTNKNHPEVIGVSDGKALGTYIEHIFEDILSNKYEIEIGSSARGIDLPNKHINTDIKTTIIKQPQSSCPFKDARQKIYGLGYNILLFVYEKDDNQENNLKFLHTRFIRADRTADYQTTRGLNEIIERDGNLDDIEAFLIERKLPVDEITLEQIAQEILKNPPKIGYFTISNALQWRLQYRRVIDIEENIEGIVKVYDT